YKGTELDVKNASTCYKGTELDVKNASTCYKACQLTLLVFFFSSCVHNLLFLSYSFPKHKISQIYN
ncbi:UNVERIFIED_CONTAM: hypothetical protein FKN15_066119, partial [Acipenser sinensis]